MQPDGAWLDLVLIETERDLTMAVDNLEPPDRKAIVDDLRLVLGMTADEMELAFLRVLIERARPFALPAQLWARSPTDTSSIREGARNHLVDLGLSVSDKRLQAMQSMYARFSTGRRQPRIAEGDLRAHNYRCRHCGLRFYNDELAELGLVSPFGNRPLTKSDALKPHWANAAKRRPTVDHTWPVSLYGDNSPANLAVMCSGCNGGKANYIALCQTRAFVGMPARADLTGGTTVSWETFYAQLLRQPRCVETGKSAVDVELTVRTKIGGVAPVIDNLETVVSPDL